MKLIDGNHRLYKAVKTGKQTVKAYFLDASQHVRYIEAYDESLYQRIISEFYG